MMGERGAWWKQCWGVWMRVWLLAGGPGLASLPEIQIDESRVM